MMDGQERAMRQAFIRHLVAKLQCSSCSSKYAPNDIYVLGHRDDVWVSAVFCSRCGTQGLVFATVLGGQFELKSAALSDLTEQEQALYARLPGLSADDVLDVHAFLRDFHGDVTGLWTRDTRG